MSGAASAVVMQRVWRGVCARRRFTELLYVTLQDQLREDFVSEQPSPAAAAPVSRRRSQTPSLEEAQEEATISQFFHPNGGEPHDSQCVQPPPPLRIQGSSSDTVPPAARTGPPSPNEQWAPSTGAQSLPRDAGASANGGHSRAGSGGAIPSALVRGDSGHSDSGRSGRTAEEDADDLQFSDELASTMSHEALRDLASVLGRLSATRSRVLTSLVEKRDALRHERSQRQALVEQLLMQVDRSRSLRKVKPHSRR